MLIGGNSKKKKKKDANQCITNNVNYLLKHAEIRNRPVQNKFNTLFCKIKTPVQNKRPPMQNLISSTELTLDGVQRGRKKSNPVDNEFIFPGRECPSFTM